MLIQKNKYKSKFIKESVISAKTEFDSEFKSDEQILRISIASELSAINLYQQLAQQTDNKKLQRILLDVAREEKVHVSEFEAMLRKIDKEQVDSDIEGTEEIEDI